MGKGIPGRKLRIFWEIWQSEESIVRGKWHDLEVFVEGGWRSGVEGEKATRWIPDGVVGVVDQTWRLECGLAMPFIMKQARETSPHGFQSAVV